MPGQMASSITPVWIEPFCPNPGAPLETLSKQAWPDWARFYNVYLLYLFVLPTRDWLYTIGATVWCVLGREFSAEDPDNHRQNTQPQTCTKHSPSKHKWFTTNKTIKRETITKTKTNNAKRKQILKLTNSVTPLIIFTGYYLAILNCIGWWLSFNGPLDHSGLGDALEQQETSTGIWTNHKKTTWSK